MGAALRPFAGTSARGRDAALFFACQYPTPQRSTLLWGGIGAYFTWTVIFSDSTLGLNGT